MSCDLCDLLDREEEIIYQDNDLVVAVRDSVLSPGQITIFPRKHFTIWEMVPNTILEKCSSWAKKVCVAAFESLGSQGTNIIIRNGVGAGQTAPHFSVEVVPRQEGDGLNLIWEPKPLMEDEIESTFLALKDESGKLVLEEKKSGSRKDEINKINTDSDEKKKDKPGVKEDSSSGEKPKNDLKENYLLKSLRRRP